MTEPGYPGAPAPEPGNPQAPGVPGQFPPPQPTYGAPQPNYGAPQPGYGQPQQNYGAPQPGYSQPQQQNFGAPQQPGSMPPAQFAPPPPPPGYASAEDKTWALVAHFGGAIGAFFCGVLSFVGPLIAYFAKGSTSPTVRQHAAAAFNFQVIVSAVGLVLTILRFAVAASLSGVALVLFLDFIGFLVIVAGVVFGILGGMRANEGTVFKYPVSVPLLK